MKCCICGPVRNCGKYLDKVFKNIEKIGSIFSEYKIIIYYDHSTDNSLEILKKYELKNKRLKLFVNCKLTSQYRTHRLATARNFCLDYIKKNYSADEYPYFIMMDFDDVNCKNINIDVLKKHLKRNDWDGLSFNTEPKYYDIWALSIFPYNFSYNHFKNSGLHNYFVIQEYIMRRLQLLPKGKLLQCISAFNGFSIYRTKLFLNSRYDGRVRIDLFPKKYIDTHSIYSNSKVIFPNLENANCLFEDCEHRAFHILATKNSSAKIMISPEIVFN
jgi:hypothetical protein